MTNTESCIIEAGTVLCGLDASGRMQMRHDVAIWVHEGKIAQIGPLAAVGSNSGGLKRYGSPGMIAMPGLVNSHHHSGLTPLMMGVPFAPLELWLPQFRAMRGVGDRLDTLYSAIEMLESGTTTVHHIHGGLSPNPNEWDDTVDSVIGAYREIGMRAGFSFMMRDRNVLTYNDDAEVLATLPAPLRAWLEPRISSALTPTAAYMAFFKESKAKWAAKAGSLVRHHLAPANLHWMTDDSLQLIVETARTEGANLHMHLVETERQALFAEERYGRSAVAHLHALGCLGPELTFGHGNWMSRSDLDLLAECGCSVCHNASSGLRLGSGIAPVNQLRQRGVKVALGIDQSNIMDDRDMLVEMKLAWALHRETGMWNDRPSAGHILQMATEHGARTAGFGGSVGRLEPGQQADIVLLSRDAVARPWLDPDTTMADAVVLRATKAAVDQVFVAGKLVVDKGRAIGVDRDAVLAEIKARLDRPASPAEAEARTMVAAIQPYLEAFNRSHTRTDSYRPYRYNAMNDG
jgi:5-methylthioadenosine/S-adenosylhomocysteine deaminase